MKIADLFVKVSIKGSEVVQKNFKKMEGGFKTLIFKASKFTLIAAGVALALKKIFLGGREAGASLERFSLNTGISIKTLQQWQAAGKKIGATNEDVMQSFLGVQRTFNNILLGGRPPKGLFLIQQETGLDIEKATGPGGTIYAMKKLQEFARSNKFKTSIESEFLISAGVVESVAAGMQKGVFVAENFKDAIVLKKNEAEGLSKVNAELKTFFETAIKAANKLQAFFSPATVSALKIMTKQIKNFVGFLEKIPRIVDSIEGFFKGKTSFLFKQPQGVTAGRAPQGATVNQTFNIYGGQDPKETGRAARDGAKEGVKGINKAIQNIKGKGEVN